MKTRFIMFPLEGRKPAKRQPIKQTIDNYSLAFNERFASMGFPEVRVDQHCFQCFPDAAIECFKQSKNPLNQSVSETKLGAIEPW